MHSKKHPILYILIRYKDEYTNDYIQSLAARHKAGIYIDDCTAGIRERPKWDRLEIDIIDGLVSQVIVPSLRGLALSPSGMMDSLRILTAHGVHILSHQERLDTQKSNHGETTFSILQAVAEAYKNLKVCRNRNPSGAKIGRPLLLTPDDINYIRLQKAKGRSVRAIKKDLEINRRTYASIGTIHAAIESTKPISAN